MSHSLVLQQPSKPPAPAPSEMEKKREEINPKLVKVLKKLLEPKFKLHNDDYLNLLLTHLTKKSGCKVTPREVDVNKQFLTIWLKGATMHFERVTETNPNLLTFVLNITRYLCEFEQYFVKLNSDDIFDRLTVIVKRVSHPNVTTAFIKVMSEFLEHKSGLQWIISTNHWELFIDIVLNNETIYVAKEGYKFVAYMLIKSHSFNTSFCKNVIQYILSPLDGASKSLSENRISDIENKKLTSTLRLLSEVLNILFAPAGLSNENSVICMFIDTFHLEQRIRKIITTTNSTDLKGALYQIVIFLSLYDLKLSFIERRVDVSPIIFDILYEAANNVPVPCMLHLLFTTLSCWSNVKASLPHPLRSDSTVLSFEDQLLAIQLMPMYSIFVKTIGFNVYTSESEDSFRFIFISKLVDRLYPKTIRVKYKWQSYLLDNYSVSNGILALKYFIHSKKFYSKESAILALQMMIYLIEDLISTLKDKPELQVQFVNDCDYLDLHLKVISVIIEEFKLTWRDTVESLCVSFIVVMLLKGMVWPTKIVVSALKLAEKGISKYMSFQMAMILDYRDDSIWNEYPGLLRVKLHDGAWEVRDSAIELIQSLFIASNNTAFCTYKKFLIQIGLPCLILRMAEDDGNAFVRASALRCMQKAIKIPEFWEDITNKANIYSIVLKTLQHETEGIVRCEAAILVDCIYEHQHIPEDLMNNFYDTMSHAVISDLHWEVRVKAMNFWKRVISDHLSQQGMIDGSFPTITFSKVDRKIITLSSIEVRKRLVHVLYDLAQTGCLAVFYEALKDDCDIEVSKFATESLKDFVELLKSHDVTLPSLKELAPPIVGSQTFEKDEFAVPMATPSCLDEFMVSSPQFQSISDSVLEDILDTRDLNLLETVFNTLDQPVVEHIETKKRKVLDPEQFLNLVYSDLENRLTEKTQWVENIDSFQSLLDDILRDYEVTDVNTMDCY